MKKLSAKHKGWALDLGSHALVLAWLWLGLYSGQAPSFLICDITGALFALTSVFFIFGARTPIHNSIYKRRPTLPCQIDVPLYWVDMWAAGRVDVFLAGCLALILFADMLLRLQAFRPALQDERVSV